MATVHSLATETLTRIFELAHDPHKPSTMKRAALVCRAWRHPAQRALFQDIVVRVDFENGYETDSEEIDEEDEEWEPSMRDRKWETYRSNRLYLPRRIELKAPTREELLISDLSFDDEDGRYEPNHPPVQSEFRWCSGVKVLTIRRGELHLDFLTDQNLQSVETLNLVDISSYSLSGLQRRFAWPTSLRRLSFCLSTIRFLVDAYEPREGLEYIQINLPAYFLKGLSDKLSKLQPFLTGLRDCALTLTTSRTACPDLQPLYNILTHLTHFTIRITNHIKSSATPRFFHSLVGTLPSTITRLTLERGDNWEWMHPSSLLYTIPFEKIMLVLSDLEQLKRLDFPDVKRVDLEALAAAADLLAECERRSIRVVCWEEFT
ncbi:hypothetical protein RQP46_008131 [Phenoliferia psychrophenolica]